VPDAKATKPAITAGQNVTDQSAGQPAVATPRVLAIKGIARHVKKKTARLPFEDNEAKPGT
jgi:hypothetical protein